MYNIFSIHRMVYILTHIFLFGMLTYQHLHLLDQCIFAIPGLYTKLWIGLEVCATRRQRQHKIVRDTQSYIRSYTVETASYLQDQVIKEPCLIHISLESSILNIHKHNKHAMKNTFDIKILIFIIRKFHETLHFFLSRLAQIRFQKFSFLKMFFMINYVKLIMILFCDISFH